MRKISFVIFLAAFVSPLIFSQSLQMAESKYYRVYTDTDIKTAEEIASGMDSYLSLFNKYLHFDTDNLPSKLKIRFFKDKKGFDSYLNMTVSRTSGNYVLLQYRDPSKNELVAYMLPDMDTMRKDFIHYGLIQFFKAYVYHPPLWMMSGFAVYFENTPFDEDSGTVTFRENYSWIPTLKKAISDGKTIAIDDLLAMDLPEAEKNLNVFYAQSWAMIDFLLSSKYLDYNRILWDSISALKRDASADENERAVISKAFKWVDKKTFAADFIEYAKSLKTFSELISDGINAYNGKDYSTAEKLFLDSINIDSENEIPYYYLGLIDYAKGDYTAAESFYHSALKYTSDKDRVYYALAVNAFADSRFEDVSFYIDSMSSGGKLKYKDTIKELTERIKEKKK